MRKSIAIVLAAAFALSGCGGTSGRVSDEEVAGSNRPTETSPAESTPTTEAPPPVVNPKFGETYTYEDGLVVTIGTPQPYTPSESAAVGEPRPPAFVVFDVTVVNGSQANYEPAIFSVSLQSANVEEQQVFDSANGIGGTPTTPILPGREAAFRLAFGATNPNDLVMQVSPSFEHEPIIFTS
jgi:hypothetical protein